MVTTLIDIRHDRYTYGRNLYGVTLVIFMRSFIMMTCHRFIEVVTPLDVTAGARVRHRSPFIKCNTCGQSWSQQIATVLVHPMSDEMSSECTQDFQVLAIVENGLVSRVLSRVWGNQALDLNEQSLACLSLYFRVLFKKLTLLFKLWVGW